MVHDINERIGSIDILVNNAGIAAIRGLEEIAEEDFDRRATTLISWFVVPRRVSRHDEPIIIEQRFRKIPPIESNVSTVKGNGWRRTPSI